MSHPRTIGGGGEVEPLRQPQGRLGELSEQARQLTEGATITGAGDLGSFEGVEGSAIGLDGLGQTLCGLGADPLENLKDPEPGGGVEGVEGHPEQGTDVLDVGRLDKANPPELAKRHIARRQLELDHVGVPRGTAEDGDLGERNPLLAKRQDALAEVLGLGGVVEGADEDRFLLAGDLGEESLREPLLGPAQHRVAEVEDGLGAAVVLFEHRRRAIGEELGKVDDVAEVGAAKRVDALGVVPHHHHVAVARCQQGGDLGLEPVGVLVLVDQDVSVGRRQARPHGAVLDQQAAQVGQQVVVVHDALFELAPGKRLGELLDRRQIVLELGHLALNQLGQRAVGVDAFRDQVDQGIGPREAPPLAFVTSLGTEDPHQVDGVATVGDGERR